MVAIVLVIAFVVEAASAGARWVEPSRSTWVRRTARIGMGGAFWLVTLAGIIPWSFRWYGLAGLLSAWAVREAWLLYRRREAPPAIPSARVVLEAGVALLLIFVAVTPALVFPPYVLPEPTGRYAVASARYTLVDEERSETFPATNGPREVNVEFWYPQQADGVFPLVVFSHGGLSIGRSNLSLYRELASHGYVVSAVEHPYHALWTRDGQGQITFLSWTYFGELGREDARSDRLQSYRYYQRWMDTRMGDINLVLDEVLASAAAGVAGIYRLVDTQRIGIMGHSLGGSAALGIGRQRSDVAAVIALEAPFMYDIAGVEDDQFVFIRDPYPVPVLNVYSESAWPHLAEWPQYARNAALLNHPGTTAAHAHISGVGHLGLTDLVLSSPFLVRLLDGIRPTEDGTDHIHTINALCLEFLDSYLKDQAELGRQPGAAYGGP